jgi:hypothetical protein
MTTQEALKTLQDYRHWCQGPTDVGFHGAGLTIKEVGKAIDTAIDCLAYLHTLPHLQDTVEVAYVQDSHLVERPEYCVGSGRIGAHMVDVATVQVLKRSCCVVAITPEDDPLLVGESASRQFAGDHMQEAAGIVDRAIKDAQP